MTPYDQLEARFRELSHLGHAQASRCFPTYSVGALTAAQWFAAARNANPQLERQIETGELHPLIAWLRREIHGRGQLLGARELLVQVTGEALDPRPFKAHLEGRYLAD